MKLAFTKKADKGYKKLSSIIQKKADKQFLHLLNNSSHPSLRSRKMSKDTFEARIDYHYRFTFIIEEDTIFILSIGMHDEGLGKK